MLDDLSRREFQLIALCLLAGCGALDLSMRYLTATSGAPAGGCDGAGNCYVRAGAKGAENGADWTNAFPALPSGLTRGVTYYVAAGTYPGHLFADPDSGSTYITVQAATQAKHGTSVGWSNDFAGQAVFNSADSSGVGDIFTFQSDYYLIDGAYRATTTGQPQIDWKDEYGYGFSLNNERKVACNADIDLGDNSKTLPNPVHHVFIQYVNVNGSHETAPNGCRENGFAAMWGSHDYSLQYSYVHHTGLTILFLRGEHANCSGPPGNVSCSMPSTGYGSGSNINVKNNYFSQNFSDSYRHAEGCSCSEGLQNLTIADNYWQDISGSGIIATASGADWNNGNGGNGPWYIYGNIAFETSCAVYTGTKSAGVSGFLYKWDTTFIDAIYVLNNTVFNFLDECNSGSGVQLDNGAQPSPAKAIFVADNLWASSAQIQIDNTCPSAGGYPSCTSMNHEYNSYFASPDNSGDADSDPNAEVSTSRARFVNAVNHDFRLTSDTRPGVNTNSLVPSNAADLMGIIRGANGTWDRGALQIGKASGTAPARRK